MFASPYLENDGVPLQLRQVLEDEVDDVQVFVPQQETRCVLLEVVQEVVEDKIGPCNAQKTFTSYYVLSFTVFSS